MNSPPVRIVSAVVRQLASDTRRWMALIFPASRQKAESKSSRVRAPARASLLIAICGRLLTTLLKCLIVKLADIDRVSHADCIHTDHCPSLVNSSSSSTCLSVRNSSVERRSPTILPVACLMASLRASHSSVTDSGSSYQLREIIL
jgi:hypothetical protein